MNARNDAAERGPLPDGRQRRGDAAFELFHLFCGEDDARLLVWSFDELRGWLELAAFVAQRRRHWVRSRIVLVDTWRCFLRAARGMSSADLAALLQRFSFTACVRRGQLRGTPGGEI